MTYLNFPNGVGFQGRIKYRQLPARTITILQSTTQQDIELEIPALGDVAGVIVDYTVSVTGALSVQQTLDTVFSIVQARDVNGVEWMSFIRGTDIMLVYERYMNLGRFRTIAVVANAAGTDRSVIPLNIERAQLPARLVMTINSAVGLATGGTGGTVTYVVTVMYADKTAVPYTQRARRITQAVVSGTNPLQQLLPRGVVVEDLFLGIGTEANFTNFTYQPTGGAEIDQVPLGALIGMENCRLVSGHQTGFVDTNAAPAVVSDITACSLQASGSDTLQIFTVHYFPSDLKKTN